MAKPSLVFVCRDCGGESLRWAGQCPHCRAWNTLEELQLARRPQAVRAGAGRPSAVPLELSKIDLSDNPRMRLGWEELNRPLGGGVVPGSVILLAGEPGVGKSTLLMHLAVQASRAGDKVLYASGEESAHQIGLRARRLGAETSAVWLLAETDLDRIVAAAELERPALLIVDSIQTVADASVDAAPGSVSQVRDCAARLSRLAKESALPVVLVGHVTKEGAIAGPRVLEHMVDVVLSLEGERQQEYRILRAQKNRFGSTEEIGVFAMGEAGFSEVQDPGAALISELGPTPGSVIMVSLEGSRPLLVEIQTLVSSTPFGLPRRTATGIDPSRLQMVIAVLDKRAGLSLSSSDVFANVAGGFRVAEPAADLPLALSLAGNLREAPMAAGCIAIGELGLNGEVRRVTQLERRLTEAQRRGFTRALIPRGTVHARAGIDLVEVRDLRQAIALAFAGSPAGAQA
ncbi:MAG: DNA repair protein RadA [Candidatus Dormibacteraceae bacterium]